MSRYFINVYDSPTDTIPTTTVSAPTYAEALLLRYTFIGQGMFATIIDW